MSTRFWEPGEGTEPILDLPKAEAVAAPPRNILEFPEAQFGSDKDGSGPGGGGVAATTEFPMARADEIQSDARRRARELVIEARREVAELRAAAAKDREDARTLLMTAQVDAAKIREEARTGAVVQAATVRVEAEEAAKARRHSEALRTTARVAEEKFEAAIALARQRLR